MQTLTVDFICSLDGFGSAVGWPGWWGMESPEYLGWLEESPTKNDPLLMGATTYRVMSERTAGGEPGTDVLNGIRKYVFSSSLHAPLTWANSTLVNTDAVDYVRRLKDESDQPLRTIGSISLPLDGPPGR